MQAIEAASFGGPEVMELREVPVPQPSEDQVLIKLAFSGVNYTDIYRRSGHYASSPTYPTPLPYRPGIEASGVVAAVGAGVSGLREGDRVAFCMSPGTYAEYAVAPAQRTVRLPDGIALEQAAAVMVQGMTAHYLSHSVFSLTPGDTCLIHAGAGGVGQLLIQMARMQGARVFATVGSPEKAEIAKARGADQVILYREADFRDAVLQATGGRGVDVVYDSVGRATIDRSIRSLRPLGICVLFGHTSGLVECVEPMGLSEAGSVFFTRPHMEHYVRTAEDFQRRANDVFRWVIWGKLVVSGAHSFALAEAGEAHRLLESRRARDKIVLNVAAGAV